ncbi:transposase [Dryocola sp. LX212]|jgi:hypothetical protein
MGTPRFTPEFKEEAVRQITERGYSVAEVSDRLSVSAFGLYKWLLAIINEHRAVRGIMTMCRLLNVARADFIRGYKVVHRILPSLSLIVYRGSLPSCRLIRSGMH